MKLLNLEEYSLSPLLDDCYSHINNHQRLWLFVEEGLYNYIVDVRKLMSLHDPQA